MGFGADKPPASPLPISLFQLWKSYAYTRNQRIQQLSPFEVDVLGPLFRDIGHKFKHKVEVCVADGLRRKHILGALVLLLLYFLLLHTCCCVVLTRLQDNAFDVVPPLAFFMGLIYFVKWKRQDMMLHHRD